MNNIEKILDRISSDAAAQAEKIISEAEENSRRIREDYEDRAKAACDKILEDARNTAVTRAERRDSAAQLDARNYTLDIKQQVLSQVFDKAAEALADLPDKEYSSFLAHLAAKASESGDEEIIFSASDREKVGADVVSAANGLLSAAGRKGELTLSDRTADIRGGFILARGRIETNCSVDVLVGSYKDELTLDIAKILFE